MNGFKRRKVAGLAAGASVKKIGLVSARHQKLTGHEADAHAAQTAHVAAEAHADGAGPLPEPAAAWIGRLRDRGQTHLFYPVSRLQREFRLGYGQACALAGVLAQCGEWKIGFSTDGTRYARIPPGTGCRPGAS